MSTVSKSTIMLLAALTSISTAVAVAPPAFADDISDLRTQATRVQEEIDEMQVKLDEASRDYGDALARAEQAEESAHEARDKQAEVEAELDDIHNRMDKRAVYCYKTDVATLVDMLLAANSLNDVEQILTMMEKLDEYDRELKKQEEQLMTEWQQREEEAEAKGVEATRNKDEALAAEETARQEINRLEDVYADIDAQVSSLLYRQRLEVAYNTTAAAPDDNGGTNWNDVKAPTDANDVVSRAYSALGSPYSWGGVGANGGYDCSGLVSYCISGENTRIGTTGTFMGYEQTNDPEPGDIVTSGSHCGIYIGDGQMIHASDYGTGVIIGNVQPDMIAVKP